jgi:Outer membrane protein beta-barrel domain
MRLKSLVLLTSLVLASAAPARAEGFISGFGGATFGGDTDKSRAVFGGSLGWLGGGVLGLEVLFDYSPHFFGDETVVGENNLTTLMGNIIIGAPIDRSRIYASGGAGLMKSHVRDVDEFFDVHHNDWGINVGGGVIGYVSHNVGVRADIRFFRDMADHQPGAGIDLDLGKFNYWAGTAGITIRF